MTPLVAISFRLFAFSAPKNPSRSQETRNQPERTPASLHRPAAMDPGISGEPFSPQLPLHLSPSVCVARARAAFVVPQIHPRFTRTRCSMKCILRYYGLSQGAHCGGHRGRTSRRTSSAPCSTSSLASPTAPACAPSAARGATPRASSSRRPRARAPQVQLLQLQPLPGNDRRPPHPAARGRGG